MDYYAVLKVENTATDDELRVAFRRMVKKYHPDVNARRKAWAHVQMKKVLVAYRVLSDAAQRAVYDRRLRYEREGQRDHYRERLASRNDLRSRAKLILYDLLQGNEEQAVLLYEATLGENVDFGVDDHLKPRDWMDCKFLLAEEYERRKAYVRALGLYEEIYYSQHAKNHYQHFLGEVADRIRNLCCRDLARSVEPADAILYYQRALNMDLTRSDRAFMHKKMAECYERLGETDRALTQLRRAFKLKPDLKGCQKICQKLGFAGD